MEVSKKVRDLMDKWRLKGEEAGKKEGWMQLEEGLDEDLERHPELARDAGELVQLGIDSWEETTHFEMLYGSPILDDAKEVAEEEADPEAWTDYYIDLKSEFWDGYINGRKSIGIDVYAVAKKLIDKQKRKSKSKVGYSVKAGRKGKSKSVSEGGLGTTR